MKKTEALNPKAIEQIAKFRGKIYKFDLSRLNIETFDSLMKSVPMQFLVNSDGLGFNCDLLVKTDRKNEQMMTDNPRTNRSPVYPLALQSSAAKKKKDFTKILAKSVSSALSHSEKIQFLKFRFIPFQYNDIEMLASAIFANDYLRVLRFCDVPLGDQGFARLCRALRKRSITEVQFRKCQLTDACTDDLRALLSFHVFVQSEAQWKESAMGNRSSETVCLQSLDLRDNEFTYQFVNIIEDAILDLPLKLLDLRGNTGLTSNMLKQLQQKVPRTQIKCGLSPLPKSTLPQYLTEQQQHVPIERKTAKGPSARTKRIQKLEDENRRLHALIEELQMGVNIAELENDLLIVGPRASEFVTQVTQLDLLLANSEHGPHPFLESTRRKVSEDVKRMITSRKRNPNQKVPKKKASKKAPTKQAYRTMLDRSSSPRKK